MSVAPKFAATRLVFGTPAASSSSILPSRHTIEVYLDYCCPFSAKIFRTLQSTVVPLIRENVSWANSVELILRQQIQPWHPSSTLMHEAALAVLATAPEKYWDFSAALFDEQKEYFDANVVDETRNATYKRLAQLAERSVGVDAAQVLEKLLISNKPNPNGDLNGGNTVTADLKFLTRAQRTVGVHITPTVVFNGVMRTEVSSSWTGDQWKEFLSQNAV